MKNDRISRSKSKLQNGNKLSRRTFLKLSALTGSAFGVSPLAVPFDAGAASQKGAQNGLKRRVDLEFVPQLPCPLCDSRPDCKRQGRPDCRESPLPRFRRKDLPSCSHWPSSPIRQRTLKESPEANEPGERKEHRSQMGAYLLEPGHRGNGEAPQISPGWEAAPEASSLLRSQHGQR